MPPRQRKVCSAAWEYFQVVDGGAQCKLEGCTHKFLKRASGSSTKFLWSHLEAHHRELSRELGRQGKKRKRIVNKNKITNGRSETIDIHCYPPSSSHIPPSFVYTQSNIPSATNTMNMNLMDLINNETTSANNLNSTLSQSSPVQPPLSVNEYFCKMLCAQLNQMTEKQAHMAREKIQSFIGQILFTEQQRPQPQHKLPLFNQQYS